MGVSLVAPDQEVAYARVAGIRARATSSAVRRTLELQLRSIQVWHHALCTFNIPTLCQPRLYCFSPRELCVRCGLISPLLWWKHVLNILLMVSITACSLQRARVMRARAGGQPAAGGHLPGGAGDAGSRTRAHPCAAAAS